MGVLLSVSVAACGQSIPNSQSEVRLEASRSLFSQWDHGPDLRAQAQAKNKNISRHIIVREESILCNNCPKPDPSNHPAVRMAAVASDVVLIARNIQNVSGLTTNDAFAFTNTQMSVQEVWKGSGSDTSKGQILPGEEITVSSPGGTVYVDGHTINVSLSNQLTLQVGHSYLLFLRYIPQSSTYVASSLDGFDITGSTVIPLRKTMIPPLGDYLTNPTTFLNLMHQATNRAINAEDAK